MEKNLKDLEKVYAQMAFIHQRLTQTSQYFVEEFEIAKDAITTVTDMANKLRKEIDELKAEEVANKESNNESANSETEKA